MAAEGAPVACRWCSDGPLMVSDGAPMAPGEVPKNKNEDWRD